MSYMDGFWNGLTAGIALSIWLAISAYWLLEWWQTRANLRADRRRHARR